MSERYTASIIARAALAGLVGGTLAARLTRKLVTIELSAGSVQLADRLAALMGTSRQAIVLIALSLARELNLPPGAQAPDVAAKVSVEPSRVTADRLLPLPMSVVTGYAVAGLYHLDRI